MKTGRKFCQSLLTLKAAFISLAGLPWHSKIESPHLRLASKADIAAMKCSAILSRSELKDYVDLYYLVKELSLETIMESLTKKMPELSHTLVLKSLSYVEDVSNDTLLFMPGFEVSLAEVKKFLEKEVNKYAQKVLA